MITVIGKLSDTKKYIGKPGYNVLEKSADWTFEFNAKWIAEAVERGDDILIVSTSNVSGWFREELFELFRLLSLKNAE